MSVLNSILRDIESAKEKDPAARSAVEVVLTYPGFQARQLHRLARTLHMAGVPLVPRLIAHFNRMFTGIDIHPGAEIGEGLFIDHGMGLVIGETAVIGDDCQLMQDVTLGGTSTKREKRHPTLGDHVTVGAGAKLIGAITIGDHARIGAGSVVVTNVPPYSTVVGVPGKVVAYYDPGDDTVVRQPDPEWDRIEELGQTVEQLQTRIARLEAALAEAEARASAAANLRG